MFEHAVKNKALSVNYFYVDVFKENEHSIGGSTVHLLV